MTGRSTLPILLLLAAPLSAQQVAATVPRFSVTFPAAKSAEPIDGRLLVMLSSDTAAEPRFQISDISESQVIAGMDVEGWRPGAPAVLDTRALAYPMKSLAEVPAGRYRVQALVNRYQTFHRADGKVVKLPPDRGEGQQWNRKPGNLYSAPRWIDWNPRRPATIRLVLDQEIPPIPPPTETKYVRYERIQSKLLSDFWGTPVFLGAHVLLPQGFDEHPDARYPLVIDHGHFPEALSGWREQPPDANLVADYSERFKLAGYNFIQQDYAWRFFQDWIGPGFPRVLLIEIQHPTPYYDDSYAVNSENNGPYGDAIMQELVPYIERKYRGIGQGYARFAYGGSTGGWEAMAVQLFYPDDFNGAWVACPDPIDFRQYTNLNIYEDTNAYWQPYRWKRMARPGHRDYLGNIHTTIQQMNQLEAVIASHGRSGGQWDIWQAVYSPAGDDGYPAPIWDKATGDIDPAVAAYWREHFDLGHILERDWATLGPKVRGKLHIYVGEADNYFLNDAVYLVEDFLKSATNPAADAEVDYEPRAEHCWNGDHTRANAYSRLRYPQMFIPRIMDQIRKNHPAGADTTSWRY
jgi:putative esterase